MWIKSLFFGLVVSDEYQCRPSSEITCFDRCYRLVELADSNVGYKFHFRTHRLCSSHAMVTTKPEHFELCTIKFIGCYEPCTNESSEENTERITCFHTLWSCQSKCSKEVTSHTKILTLKFALVKMSEELPV